MVIQILHLKPIL